MNLETFKNRHHIYDAETFSSEYGFAQLVENIDKKGYYQTYILFKNRAKILSRIAI